LFPFFFANLYETLLRIYIAKDKMSTPDEVNEIVARVATNKALWTRVSLQDKLNYLLEIQQKLETLVEKWGLESNRVRKIANLPYLNGFGFMAGPGGCGMTLNAVIDTYVEIIASGKAPQPISVRKQGDQNIVTVHPNKMLDKILANGSRGELYLEPGKPVEQAKTFFEATDSPGKLCAVFGPGNYDAPCDCLAKLFFEHCVVIFKPHPLNASATVPFFK
jgi:hypothetical protein